MAGVPLITVIYTLTIALSILRPPFLSCHERTTAEKNPRTRPIIAAKETIIIEFASPFNIY